MNLIYLEPDDLTREEVESFWKQGVCMDDFDYMLLLPENTMMTDPYEEKVEPENYYLSNLLQGCCYNHWYYANYQGAPYVIGIAYHS